MHANETTTDDEGETRREAEEQNQQTEVKTLLLQLTSLIHKVEETPNFFSNFQKDIENYTAGNAEPATDTTNQGREQEQMGTNTTPTTEVVDEEVQRDIEEAKVKNHNLEINIL